ncbi:DUF202 domain-containing protein [Streptomyces meridianus]|uniref:DUF202 domain-containing protein n=1 Tax=Streptomyces meridianus TaxID=2938945 RepID=A0ABT0X8I4_9ACTN|nr:DUF202 domain-containing protein [Streptomyces meridianus]MCM2578223.1 DUF202 domain-containing protein [Streptomyces meridianus]
MPPVQDPGLQPERTRLAWRRTTLSAAVVVVLAAREAARRGAAPAALLGVALSVGLLLVFLATAQRRMHQLGSARPADLVPATALLVTACTVALAVLGAVTLP